METLTAEEKLTPLVRGKRIYGHWIESATGEKTLEVTRLFKHQFCPKHHNLSDAMRENEAWWWVHFEYIIAARAKGFDHIRILAKDTGDTYTVRTEEFFNKDKYRSFDGVAGAKKDCRFLRVGEFTLKRSLLKLVKLRV